jgi:uncharacterized membrane protein YfhO
MQGGTGGTVRVLSETRQQVVVETESSGPSYLATSETHYPGWSARIDGRPAPVYYTNVAFRGVPLPAGRHRVEFEFHCPRARTGAAVTALALLAWAALLGRAWKRPGG